MSQTRITLANDWPLWLMMAIGSGAVVLIVLSYWFGGRRLRRRDLAVLTVLRVIALALVVLLLFRPTLNFTARLTEKGQVIVLVDDSISMGLKDGQNVLPRLAWVQDTLARAGGVLEVLKKDFDTSLYAFSSAIRAVPSEDLASVKPTGESTRIAQAIAAVGQKADRERLAGVLIFSDGADNSGKDPTEGVTAYGVSLYTVGVGTRVDKDDDFHDLYVQDVRTPRYAIVDNVTEITVAVGGVGYSGREVTVEMKEGDAVLATAKAVIQAAGTAELATLKFTPKKPGQYDYVAEVAPDQQERVTENNRYEFSLIVTEPRVKVLYVEGVPRPEYKFLKRALESDPNVEILSLIQVSSGVFSQQGKVGDLSLSGVPDSPEVLRKFNVFILGDIDRSYFSDDQLKRIEEAVSEGAGLLMLGGRNSLGPGGYAGTPIEELLPVSVGSRDVGQVNDPFQLRLTREGQGHPIFDGTESFFAQEETPSGRPVPTLLGCTRVLNLKAGALVLAENPLAEGTDREKLPVLAVQPYGKGRSMIFTADTTWRWYLQLRPLGTETPYVRFWGQAIRWLASQEIKKAQTGPGLTAYTDKRSYQSGEPVKIRVLARDELGQAANRATITVTAGPSVESGVAPATMQLPYLAGSAGEYTSEFTPPAPGPYSVRANGTQDNAPLGQPVTASFRVGKPNVEYEKLGLNEELLRRLADLTGGKYYPLVQADQLARSLRRTEIDKQVSKAYRLWNGPYFFLVFLALVTAEWVIRRRRQMP